MRVIYASSGPYGWREINHEGHRIHISRIPGHESTLSKKLGKNSLEECLLTNRSQWPGSDYYLPKDTRPLKVLRQCIRRAEACLVLKEQISWWPDDRGANKWSPNGRWQLFLSEPASGIKTITKSIDQRIWPLRNNLVQFLWMCMEDLA